ncbi:hypothetical protein E2C01_030701 [Portunus trituberculatus]|uniref:Uncharacterized protein n=1 Tax=Portunus trituberculatus TaxID=210409 RepID=A0A5B7EVJ3_PORTR|nr:hypothetical protein [Portunus trituberculatus]
MHPSEELPEQETAVGGPCGGKSSFLIRPEDDVSRASQNHGVAARCSPEVLSHAEGHVCTLTRRIKRIGAMAGSVAERRGNTHASGCLHSPNTAKGITSTPPGTRPHFLAY